MRNRSFSAKAWHRRKHHYCNHKYISDFCAGFRTGYEDVANGTDGCTPAFPPKNYWGWEFQSAEGAARTAAWFEGYPHGVRAAEEEGVANFTQLQMSVGYQQQYHNHGMSLQPDSTLYPIPSGTSYPQSGEPVPMETFPLESGPVMPVPGADLTPGAPVPQLTAPGAIAPPAVPSATNEANDFESELLNQGQ